MVLADGFFALADASPQIWPRTEARAGAQSS